MQKCGVISELSLFGFDAEDLKSSQAMHGPECSVLSLTRYKQFVHGDHISMPSRMRQ